MGYRNCNIGMTTKRMVMIYDDNIRTVKQSIMMDDNDTYTLYCIRG